jgi:peptidoglycan/LPS O-acetylase OafA/YrhL
MKLLYRPDIDGLRAIAVLSVVAYHYAPAGVVPGGFVGVDIFFVISGFLITSIYAPDIGAGRFSFRQFYTRRARRIIPALLVVLAATNIVGYMALWPDDYVSLAKSSLSACFGISNLFFFFHSGYFDTKSSLLPLLHTWSLGVEEQFYVAWPLLLCAVVWAIGGAKSRLVTAAAVIIGVSFAASLLALARNPAAAFFLPQYRAWELAAGGVLAFLPRYELPRLVREAAGLIGLCLIGAAIVWISADDVFPGWLAVLPCAGAALLIWAPGAGDDRLVSAWLLSRPPVRAIGQISYSLYLWHWPTLVLYRHYTGNEQPGGWELLALAALAFVLATLTWLFVEQPFIGKRPVFRIAGPVALSVGAPALAVALSSVFIVYQGGFAGRVDAKIAKILLYSHYDLSTMFRSGKCFIDVNQNLGTLDLPECLPNDGHKLAVLWGSSNVAQYYAGLVGPMKERGYSLGQLTASGCRPIIGLFVPSRPQCLEFNQKALALILKRRPDLVIMGGASMMVDAEKRLFLDTIKRLTDDGIKVVALDFNASFKKYVPELLVERMRNKNADRFSYPKEFQGGDWLSSIGEKYYANWIRSNSAANYVPILAWLCPGLRCELIDSTGVPLYADSDHLTASGSKKMGPALADHILAAAADMLGSVIGRR